MRVLPPPPTSSAETQRWHVGFVRTPNRGLWRLFGGRMHVMAFRYTGEVWLLVEHNAWGLEVRTLRDAEIHRLIRLCQGRGHVVIVEPRRRDFRWLPPPGLTCVTAISALLGIRAWAFTPEQLYRSLLKRGAQSLEPP